MSSELRSAQVTKALGALAQETRLALFRLLVERGPDGLSAGLIAERLDIPPSSLSFHLRALENAGLINQRRLSRQLIYSAEFGAMNALVRYLTKNCCGSDAGCVPICEPGKAMAVSTKERKAHARVRRH